MWLDGQGNVMITDNIISTDVNQDVGYFVNRLYDINPDHAWYKLESPTGNIVQDAEDLLPITIVPHRALEEPWEQYICEEGETPSADREGRCAAYFASLNN